MRTKLAILIAALMVPLLGGCTWPFLDENGNPLPTIAIFGSPLPDRHDTPYASAPTPTFGSPTPTADGFTAQITNFDLTFNWVLTTTAGVVNLLDGGLIEVAGLAPDASAQVTVLVQRYNYHDAQATITGTSLPFDGSPGGYSVPGAHIRAGATGLPMPSQLGLRARDWKRVRPAPGCAVATRCITAAFGNARSGLPLHYLEVEFARFRNAQTSRAQYARLLDPFGSSRQAVQRRQQGFRYAVIGGFGALQLISRDIGAVTDATLAVVAQRGHYLQIAIVTGDLNYLASNVRKLLASRATAVLIRAARDAANTKPPLGLPLPTRGT